jgi:ATP-dependent NAD(P)H-hydrate dehydratase
LLSAWAGCRIVRECAKRAFEKHGRAVLTSHLVEEIGPAYASLFENGKLQWYTHYCIACYTHANC